MPNLQNARNSSWGPALLLLLLGRQLLKCLFAFSNLGGGVWGWASLSLGFVYNAVLSAPLGLLCFLIGDPWDAPADSFILMHISSPLNP